MRLTASVIELVGSLVIVGWGATAAAGRPWWWRWWGRRPAPGEGGAVVLVGLGAAIWSVGEGMALLTGTVVQLAGLGVTLVGGAVLAVAVANAERGGEQGPRTL